MTPVRTGPLPTCKFSFAGDQRGVADGDAGNIGDGVERAGRAVKGNAEITRARLRWEVFPERKQMCSQQNQSQSTIAN